MNATVRWFIASQQVKLITLITLRKVTTALIAHAGFLRVFVFVNFMISLKKTAGQHLYRQNNRRKKKEKTVFDFCKECHAPSK